ncbi:MAG: hypothetical protein VR72_05930 [Clostridiaceae bacterium BRH_c20a]|nr:MAG: hypothetical protein VR72_05930 [Clostridiaceae bacterium BRH_c20a]
MDKTKKAVALKYNPFESAPKAVALGKGEIAEKILAIAAEKGIPIVIKPEVVDRLIDVDLNQEIPPELYEVVAEILAFIYKLDKRVQE